VDIVLFRENLEGLYAGLEIYDERFQIADAIRRISKRGSERIVRAAFEFARKEGRSKVTLLHKANIMKHADGLFLQTGREVAQEYADIEFEDMIIDNAFMQMVVRPERFDVLVTTNMFGDIMSDLLAGMVGGLGVVAGANIGDDAAIFEAVHGTAPDIAGQGSANPTGILLSSLMMLRHMGLFQEADQLAQALMATLSEPAHCTPDLGGNASTIEFADHLINALFRVKNLQHS
jgi:isocitrate dehydrogenase (NAD+)